MSAGETFGDPVVFLPLIILLRAKRNIVLSSVLSGGNKSSDVFAHWDNAASPGVRMKVGGRRKRKRDPDGYENVKRETPSEMT